LTGTHIAKFRVTIRADVKCPHTAYVRHQLLRAVGMLGPKCSLVDLHVYIVGAARMKAEHLRLFGDPSCTDCMTFPTDIDSKGRASEGELLLCWPHAVSTAKAVGVAPKDELLLYAIHGLLHLCGMEDKTDAGFRMMHRLEDKILTQLGAGAIFAAGRLPTTPGRRKAPRGPKP
jgi:probable rRNA maturation factor